MSHEQHASYILNVSTRSVHSSFPPEWIKSALVLALITVWMVIGLFTYMNYSTRRPHLSLWTVAWMFYSVYLAASIGLEESPHTPFLLMASRACIGISALFMFWGSFQLSEVEARPARTRAGDGADCHLELFRGVSCSRTGCG